MSLDLMQTFPTLFPATFVKRYKRFFTDVIDLQGNLMTVHCPNTGSMKYCQVEGSSCWFSLSDNPKRKLPGTLEIVTTSHGNLAGVNTVRANHLVRHAIDSGIIEELASYDQVTAEVPYGEEKSRIDFLLEDSAGGLRDCYVEVKNVTMDRGKGLASFPD
jgi:sugar fermentation stimulation protein A